MERIIKKNGQIMELKYDSNTFDIECFESENNRAVILKRLLKPIRKEGACCDTLVADNTLLEIFYSDIIFIYNIKIYGAEHFVVAEHSEDGNAYLNHYVVSDDTLKLQNKFTYDGSSIKKCRVTLSGFIVEQDGNSGTIYELSDRKTKRFERIYNDERLNEIIASNLSVTMVSEQKRAEADHSVVDTITYFVCPRDGFRPVSSIWSELQQRNIEYSESQKYLDMLAKYFERTDRVYTDVMETEVNDGFVKNFTRKF